MSLLEEFNHVADDTAVATVEESSRNTGVSGTSSTSDTMNVVVNVRRQVIIDDVSHIRDVQS